MPAFSKTHFLIVAIVALLMATLLMCSVPPISRDALTHHLMVPKIYVQEGKIIELPHILPSYYPQLLDLLYCIPLVFKNDIAPKYIHFLFSLLTGMLIFYYLKRRIDTHFGLLGVLFFLSIPIILKLSTTVYVDLGLIFFSTGALLSLFKWHQTKFKISWLILSAVSCGLAMSTKYNGLVTFFILAAFVPLIYLRNAPPRPTSKIKTMGYVLIFCSVSLCIFSPWMVKNYQWTQNPVYPLYDKYFNPIEKKNSEDTGITMTPFQTRKLIYKESPVQTLTIPFRIFFQGKDNDPKFFDGKLNPLLLILPMLAFIKLKNGNSASERIEKKACALFAVLFILIVFFRQDMRVRWIGPSVPPLIILSVYGFKNLSIFFTHSQGIFKKIFFQVVIMPLIGILFSLNFIYLYNLYRYINPWPYFSDKITRGQYIETYRPEYAAFSYSNKILDKNTKLLGLFLGNRGYYSDHKIDFNTNFFKKIIKNARNAHEIASQLHHYKFTAIILNYDRLNYWINTNNFTVAEKKRIELFFYKTVEKIFSKDGYGLYNIRTG